MNREYIDYIGELIDHAQLDDIFCLTSKEFNEFSAEVLGSLEKQIPMKPKAVEDKIRRCPTCLGQATFQTWKHGYPVVIKMNYCQNCGQKIDWGEE